MQITETKDSRTKPNKEIFVREIQIEFVKPNNGLVGFASLVVDSNIFLSSIAIHKKLNSTGYRLTYPSKGRFAIFHSIHKEASNQIEQAIFAKLKDVMKKIKSNAQEIR